MDRTGPLEQRHTEYRLSVTLMRNAASIAGAATADHGGPAEPHYGGASVSPTLEIVRTTEAGSVADWDDRRRRKVVKMILCRESQPGGLSPCLGSGRGRRCARQGSPQPAAPADVAGSARTRAAAIDGVATSLRPIIASSLACQPSVDNRTASMMCALCVIRSTTAFASLGPWNTLVHSTRVPGWWSGSATRARCVLK
jgi:hypothetical protein